MAARANRDTASTNVFAGKNSKEKCVKKEEHVSPTPVKMAVNVLKTTQDSLVSVHEDTALHTVTCMYVIPTLV